MLSGFRRFTKTHVLKRCLAGRFNEKSVFIQASSPRSGSTLLSQVLQAIPKTCVLFEPEHAEFVPEANAAKFSQQAYVDPNQRWPEGEAFLRRAFSGRVINKWTVSQMSVRDVLAKRTIIKLVRANRLLPWICRIFQIAPPVLLIRHPCAVVASQLKYHWNITQRPEVPPHLEKYTQFKSAIAKMHAPEELLTVDWALDQHVALNQPQPHPCTIITYEDLLLRPEPIIAKIAKSWNVEINMDLAMSRLRKPSSTVSKSGIKGISGWKKNLTHQQVSRILGIAKEFGLGFYTTDAEPDYATIYGKQLAANVPKAAAA